MTTKPKHATVMYAYEDPHALGEPDFCNQDTRRIGPWKHETYCFTPEQWEMERAEIAREAAQKAWVIARMSVEVDGYYYETFSSYWKTQGGEDE